MKKNKKISKPKLIVQNIRRGLLDISRLTKLTIPEVSQWLWYQGYCDTTYKRVYAIPNDKAYADDMYIQDNKTWNINKVTEAILRSDIIDKCKMNENTKTVRKKRLIWKSNSKKKHDK